MFMLAIRSGFFTFLFAMSMTTQASTEPRNVTASPAVSQDGNFSVSWTVSKSSSDAYAEYYCLWIEVEVYKGGQNVDYVETNDCGVKKAAFSGYEDGEYTVWVTAVVEYYEFDDPYETPYEDSYTGDSVKVSVSKVSSSPGNSSSNTVTYKYDALGRVTFVVDNVNGNRDYDYDSAGNRTSVTKGNTQD